MSVQSFIPEVFSASLLASLKNAHVYAGPQVVNRNYEGDVAKAGDSVTINALSPITVSDYVPNTSSLDPETLVTTAQTLTIEQCKSFSFELDNVDARQAVSAGALLTEASQEAGYALSTEVDTYVSGLYVAGTNQGGATVVATSDAAIDVIISLKTTLDKTNTPSEGRYVIVSPEFHALLIRSNTFLDASASGSTEALLNGRVGRAFGFDVFVSNVTPESGGGNVIQAGHRSAITFVEQLSKVEAYSPEASFSDAVKGLLLFDAKVIRPESIATVIATPSE
jgi:hypothetical protein